MPVDEVEQRLAAQGWRLGTAQGKGDCAPLSICCSAGLITPQQCAVPSAETIATILGVRQHAVNIVCGTNDIGGVPAAVVREYESLPRPSGAAMRFMKSWKKSYHWRGKGNASAMFLLGCALHTGKQVAVLQLTDAGSFEDPARVYGQRLGSELRRTRARSGVQETVQACFLVPVETLIEQLRASPGSFALVRYNGTVRAPMPPCSPTCSDAHTEGAPSQNHFDAYIYDAATSAAGETATEIVAGDVAVIGDVEDEAAPPGWVAPAAVNATGREHDADALQDSIRFAHVETGMSGAVQAPAIQEGTLSAHAARELAESRAPLAGNGATVVELAPPEQAAAALPDPDETQADETQADETQADGALASSQEVNAEVAGINED
eukprot:6993760-Prymnesium_polylepis.1